MIKNIFKWISITILILFYLVNMPIIRTSDVVRDLANEELKNILYDNLRSDEYKYEFLWLTQDNNGSYKDNYPIYSLDKKFQIIRSKYSNPVIYEYDEYYAFYWFRIEESRNNEHIYINIEKSILVILYNDLLMAFK